MTPRRDRVRGRRLRRQRDRVHGSLADVYVDDLVLTTEGSQATDTVSNIVKLLIVGLK